MGHVVARYIADHMVARPHVGRMAVVPCEGRMAARPLVDRMAVRHTVRQAGITAAVTGPTIRVQELRRAPPLVSPRAWLLVRLPAIGRHPIMLRRSWLRPPRAAITLIPLASGPPMWRLP